MKNHSILSPMGWGNGAYIVHRHLESHIEGYRVVGYHPNWTLIPCILPLVAPFRNVDLVHTTPDYALFFHRRSAPIVISFQNYVLDGWMRPYSSLLQRLHYRTDLRLFTESALKKAHTVTAVSKFTAKLVRQDLACSRPIRIIYNGVDTELFRPKPSSQSDRGEIRVFFSGNLTRRKGAQWLAAIANQLEKNVQIYFTHGLRTRNTLPYHDNLKPIGPVPFKGMPTRYHQMDILLMPTVREGLSLAVLEAMSSGLPVVASDCSSLPEQIDNGRGGFLCPIGDVDAFADKINFLAESPKLRQEMGEYNRAKVEKYFTLEWMIKEYKNLFEEVLSAS